MKKVTMRSFVFFIITMMSISAFADWECTMHDNKGHRWTGSGNTKEQAGQHAMRFCIQHSSISTNCILDWCGPGN